MEVAIIIALCIVVVIVVVAMSLVLYNFMLLLSELNKRLIYVVSDILQNIDLSTPHIDMLQPESKEINLEDVLEDANESSYFDPHSYEQDHEDIN